MIKSISMYVATFVLAVSLRVHEVILTLGLVPIYLFLLTLHTPAQRIASVLVGVLLPIVEYVCIRYDMWKYTTHQYMDVPIWLPLLWAITSLFIMDVASITPIILS